MVHRSVALAVATIASACAVETTATTSQAIIGGEVSTADEFRATGMLVGTAREGAICTGTLIAPDVVLTAAHCLTPPVFGKLGFTLDIDEADGLDDVVVAAITHKHPDFDDGVDEFTDLAVRNDIGVMILERPIPGLVYEQLDRPSLEIALDPGDVLAMCGYGRETWHVSTIAQKRDAMVTTDRIAMFEFSTIAEGPQPCTGDSGAPLFAEGPDGRRIVGIVSRAMGRSSMCNTGAIITRAGQYSSWVAKMAKERDTGCNAGGAAGLPLCALVLLLRLPRRRRRPVR
jgi:hypothetical protein